MNTRILIIHNYHTHIYREPRAEGVDSPLVVELDSRPDGRKIQETIDYDNNSNDNHNNTHSDAGNA